MMVAVAVLFVLIPFLFWRGTWFGRTLSDAQISEYLANVEKPRETQHALAQISERMSRADPAIKQWYPQILALADHPLPELRLTVAWLMGQDHASEEFHERLLALLRDPHPLVRRNAALALAGFGDPAAREELRAMLRPFTVKTGEAGILTNRLEPGDVVDRDTLLGRVAVEGREEPAEIRSPLPGVVREQLLANGAVVQPGDDVTLLEPSAQHVYEALRALYLVGTLDDLEGVRRFLKPSEHMPASVSEQARLTSEQIRRNAGL